MIMIGELKEIPHEWSQLSAYIQSQSVEFQLVFTSVGGTDRSRCPQSS